VTTRKYYYAGGQRIALRESGTLHYLFSDHLDSTGVSYRPSDMQTVRQLYKAWGEVRYTSGSLPTKYTDTMRCSGVNAFGLLLTNARRLAPYPSTKIYSDSRISPTNRPPLKTRMRRSVRAPRFRPETRLRDPRA
jgi:hypothetical protein